ncbi:MAG: hypothetical protein KatS3mg068_1507 [Candidatus Sericytochromatia bacterium]|nr:MAG: hypothetical protein KatS3mg068_1507 [Candidatus Sericytochromatia bacterium]
MKVKEVRLGRSVNQKDFVFYILNKFYYDYFKMTFNPERLYPRKLQKKNGNDFDLSFLVKEIFKILKENKIIKAKSHNVYRIGRLFTDFLYWCFFKLDIFSKFSIEEKLRFIVKSVVLLNDIVYRYVTAKNIEFKPNNPVMSYPKYWFVINLRFIKIYIDRFKDELSNVNSIELKRIMKNEISFQDSDLEKFNKVMEYLVDNYYVNKDFNAYENINSWFFVIFNNMNIFDIEGFRKFRGNI